MTRLRQRMSEDMQVRNFSPHTQTAYTQQVSRFARYFQQSPECLGPEAIRAYQLYLTNDKKLAVSVRFSSRWPLSASSIRSLSRKTWRVEDVIPAPKKPQRLPVVLSPDEVLQFLACVPGPKHRAILTTCYAAGLRIFRSPSAETDRHRQPAHGHSRRPREGSEGSLRHALAEVVGAAPHVVARGTIRDRHGCSPAIGAGAGHQQGRGETSLQKRARRRCGIPKPITPPFAASRIRRPPP